MKRRNIFALTLMTMALSFQAEAAGVTPPQAWHHVNNRAYVGIPSVAVSKKNGRLWATWYAGVTAGEDSNNYVVLSTSADGGRTWKEVLVADPDGMGPCRSFDAELWVAPDGLLRWTWTERSVTLQSQAESAWAGAHADPASDRLMMVCLDAENEPTAPFPVAKRIGRGVMACKPIVTKDNRWLFPLSHWFEAPSACILETKDGTEFREIGGATLQKGARTFDEHGIVQLSDDSLWMLIRTRQGMSESRSRDGGKTWSKPEVSELGHPSARFFIRTLASGRLLLVKHGAIGEKTPNRQRLMAFLSDDDGKTWKGGLLLDGRSDISYPDGDQFADGRIVIVYDYSRLNDRVIHMAAFTEEDVLAGRNVSGKLQLHQVVSSRDKSPDSPWVDVDPRKGRSLDPDGKTIWVDGRQLVRTGRAFMSASPYSRLPNKFKNRLSKKVLASGQSPAGISFDFIPEVSKIVFEWSLVKSPCAKAPHPEANRCGIDVYCREEDRSWKFVANGPSTKRFDNRLELDWHSGRECRVYLPANHEIRKFRIGVRRGADVVSPTPVGDKPVVFFGSDNFQGVAASRPGLVLSAVTGRLLDMPTVNLGMSSMPLPEPAFLEYLKFIDASAYVFDSSWADQGGDATLRKWAEELKKKRPEAKMIFVADHLPEDRDATVDGSRLNDYGIMECARSIAAELGKPVPAAKDAETETSNAKNEGEPVERLPGLDDLVDEKK